MGILNGIHYRAQLGVEDQNFVCLVQDHFLTQHVLGPTRATRVLDIGGLVLSSQKELVDNVEIK